MIINLIKLANRLDTIGLTKEADLLDGIIKKLSSEPDSPTVDSGLGEVEIPTDILRKQWDADRLELRGMILDAIGPNHSRDKLDKIKNLFNNSCDEMIKIAESIFKPEDDIKNYLDLLHPLYFSAHSSDLEDIFGEDKVEKFSMASQRYPADYFFDILDQIIDDKTGRVFIKQKERARSLRSSLENIANKIFKY